MGNDTLTILNYPGSKKRLLDFIKKTVTDLLPQGKTVLDILCGTCAVGYGLKNQYRVISNDSEIFCYVMAKALLKNNEPFNFDEIKQSFLQSYEDNLSKLKDAFPESETEAIHIRQKDIADLIAFYKEFRTVTQDGYQKRHSNTHYDLFTTYYSNTYFGLNQSMEIDSLRCAVQSFCGAPVFDILLCCLYFAMKETVFSKDGHMAQPLNMDNNRSVLLKRREKSVFNCFMEKVDDFSHADFVTNGQDNECFNLPLSDLLNTNVIDSADLVYVDPPYTDMQYSRYYHLLETVTRYDYPEISSAKGKISSGLYRKNRFQSPLSQFGKAKTELENLIRYSADHGKILVFSYAYPKDPKTEKSDRYTMTIDELVGLFKDCYGEAATEVRSKEFEHCNNRNAEAKKVFEYLVIGKPVAKPLSDSSDVAVMEAISEIEKTVGTNRSPIYSSHLYWSQKPYNVCDILLKKLSKPGDIVCDPFMGSGVTVIQSLTCNPARIPIGIDINDYPIFLLKTLLGKYDLDDFHAEMTAVISEIARYQTVLYPCTCPHCGTETVIDKSAFSYRKDGKKKLDAVFAKCPVCQSSFSGSSKEDALAFSRYDGDECSYFENIRLIPDSRIAVRENETLFDIFTSRNIKAIDTVLRVVSGKKFYPLFVYSLIGIIHLCKITDIKSSSQWPLWTPHHNCVENNVFSLFIKSLKKTEEALFAASVSLPEKRSEALYFKDLCAGKYLIIKEGTQFVDSSLLPDESVDLIITDPPYLGQVIYSEYMQLYKPLLKTEIEYDKEILVIRTRDRIKTENDYFCDLNRAFSQISRFLKTGKYLCLYFHDASLRIWNRLIGMLENNSLQFVGLTHVSKSKSTLKNIVSPKKSMNGDAILFFKKAPGILSSEINFSEERLVEIASEIIRKRGGRATTAQLYDYGVLSYIIHSRSLSYCAEQYSDLTELFANHFTWNEKGGFWTLSD